MLVDRNDASGISGLFDAATDSWWQKRSHRWVHTWLRRAVASAITAFMLGAAMSFTTNRLWADCGEVRWKKFLSRASRWDGQSGSGSTRRLDSVGQKWRAGRSSAPAKTATDFSPTTASTSASGAWKTSSAAFSRATSESAATVDTWRPRRCLTTPRVTGAFEQLIRVLSALPPTAARNPRPAASGCRPSFFSSSRLTPAAA